jgi:PAS domain S-box-containing protein
MNYQDRSKEQLIEQLKAQEKDLAELKILRSTVAAQHELTASWGKMGQAAAGKLRLKSMLLTVIQLANRMTQAQESSIFLLDEQGAVRDAILARGATVQEQKKNLIGQVFDQGLAGWVIRHRQIGLIEDTKTDDRWFTLPNEPYTVRSALCLPILKGTVLLGLLTLMHSQPGHFNDRAILAPMEAIAIQMALILDNAQLHIDLENLQINNRSHIFPPSEEFLDLDFSELREPTTSDFDRLSGFYIMTATGKFVYANSRFARIFKYSLKEFKKLDSFFDLVMPHSYDLVVEKINQCVSGNSKNLYCQLTGRRKSGQIIDLEIEGARIQFYGIFGVIGCLRLL